MPYSGRNQKILTAADQCQASTDFILEKENKTPQDKERERKSEAKNKEKQRERTV